MLSRVGIGTLGALAQGLRDGLPDIPGMGAKKWVELFGALVEMVRDLREGRLSKEVLAARFPVGGDTRELTSPVSSKFDLREDTRDLRIGILHLGTKATALVAQGIRTVGEVADMLPSLLSLSGIGRATLSTIETHLGALVEAQADDGGVDWEKFCAAIDIPLLPLAGDPVDGAEFVAGLGGVIAEVGNRLDDKVLKLVIERRLSRLPHERATLEEIGTVDGVELTRERVRQIESRFLKSMVSALLDDDYSTLDVHFRPGFASFWKAAADGFSGAEEITHGALIDGLAATWSVDGALVSAHLPFIVTIITGGIPSGRSLGDSARLGTDLNNLPPQAAVIPLRRLQLGRCIRTLEAHGLDTLGAFVDAIRKGTVSRGTGAHFRHAIDHLQKVSGALNPNGLDWTLYLTRAGASILPLGSSATPAAFLQELIPTLTAILERALPTNRAPVIFARRTSHSVAHRPTTEQLAMELGTYQSSIKQEETELLLFLNAVLVEGNLAIAGGHVRDDFLEIWKDLLGCFENSNGDADDFRKQLAAKWLMGSIEIDKAMPTMMAVLTGYPYKRLGRYTRASLNAPEVIVPLPVVAFENQDEPVRIALRGFRRHH